MACLSKLFALFSRTRTCIGSSAFGCRRHSTSISCGLRQLETSDLNGTTPSKAFGISWSCHIGRYIVSLFSSQQHHQHHSISISRRSIIYPIDSHQPNSTPISTIIMKGLLSAVIAIPALLANAATVGLARQTANVSFSNH